MKTKSEIKQTIHTYLFEETETTRLDEVYKRLFEQAEQIIRAEPLDSTV